jgi:hypothetical protein
MAASQAKMVHQGVVDDLGVDTTHTEAPGMRAGDRHPPGWLSGSGGWGRGETGAYVRIKGKREVPDESSWAGQGCRDAVV